MTDSIVNQKNYFLGCRVCRKLLLSTSSCVELSDLIPDQQMTYADALETCITIPVAEAVELPQRLCSGCSAKLMIAFNFRRDALDSDRILKSYNELEATENAIYETVENEEEYLEYETLVEYEETSCDSSKIKYEMINESAEDETNDAVSFLTGILKPNAEKTKKSPTKSKPVTVTYINSRQSATTSSDDASRKHVCNVCGKRFQKRSNLVDHLRLHADVKIYSCEHCERSFVQAGNYKAHLRVHTKEKPFSCDLCGKSYSQSSSLKIHKRSHTNERKYICDVCSKGFTNASDLTKHKLIHDPEKKYKCEECSRPFTQKVHLRKHIEKHHPNLVVD